MTYQFQQTLDLGAESQQDAAVSLESLARQAEQLQTKINLAGTNEAAEVALELAYVWLQMDLANQSWKTAKESFNHFHPLHKWDLAVTACDLMFRCNHPQSLVALGHGLWLGITFPVDPALTIDQLKHVVDDTPADSDGAAVAAAMAAYVTELRGSGLNNDDNTLAVGQLLNEVACRHGNVKDTEDFDLWFKRLELDQPQKLFVRMRNIIDVLVQDQWWIDRDTLQALIPEQN